MLLGRQNGALSRQKREILNSKKEESEEENAPQKNDRNTPETNLNLVLPLLPLLPLPLLLKTHVFISFFSQGCRENE